jgi:DNA-binding beta-propeller fold protein YncE
LAAPGRPFRIGLALAIAITPDGKTVYAAAQDKVVPISTATNKPGQPIRLRYGLPDGLVITP